MKKMVLHKLEEEFQEGLKQFIMSNPKGRSSWIKTGKRCLTNNKQKVSDDQTERSFRRVTGAEVGNELQLQKWRHHPFFKELWSFSER